MKQRIQEQIEEASLLSFSQQGFHETSTQEIAQKAGVSEASIFRLFKTKHDLYLHILTKYGNQANLDVNSIYGSISFNDVTKDLEIIAEHFFRFYFTNIHITRIYISNAIQFHELLGFNYLVFPQLKEFLERYLEEMSTRGLVPADKIPEITRLFTSSLLQDVIFLTTFQKAEDFNPDIQIKMAIKWKAVIQELGRLFGWIHA